MQFERSTKSKIGYNSSIKNILDELLKVSKDGFNFKSKKLILGPSYFRVFKFNSFFYALTYGGEIWRSPRFDQPFERGSKVLPHKTNEGIGCGFRHGDVY